jgi:hypothetical protein
MPNKTPPFITTNLTKFLQLCVKQDYVGADCCVREGNLNDNGDGKVKQSLSKSGVAQRVPGSQGSQIS